VESVRSNVSHPVSLPAIGCGCIAIQLSKRGSNKYLDSYNKYLSVAAAVVRRSLKEEHRLAAERRGQMELRFAKWTVSGIVLRICWQRKKKDIWLIDQLVQNGKQGDNKSLAEANAAAMAEAGSPSSS
jgi:F-type H+-transporting ATPase subunit epsilon